MLGYAARRLTAAIPVLLAASALTFMLAARTSDPTEELRLRQPPVPQATIEALRRDLYLDRPLLDRYWLWLTGLGDTNGDIGLLQGKWGPSVRGIDIGGEIGDRLLITVRLVGAALAAAFALALLSGSVAAARRGSNHGTSGAGHDVLGQVMRGTRLSLQVGALAGALTALLGTVWGSVAGYCRGWVDSVLMRIIDVILVVPLLVVVLVLAGGSSGTRWWYVAIVVGLFGFAGTARVVRGVVLSVREQEFVEAARSMGASAPRVLFRHVLPHTLGYVVVDATIAASAATLIEAALSFVGFGVVAPDTSLGLLVANAQTAVTTRPWLFYFPGAVLVVLCLAIQLAGDGVRDALDPR